MTLPKFGDVISFGCALCQAPIVIEFRLRTPSAFCASCLGKINRRKKEWGSTHGDAGKYGRRKLYNVYRAMLDRCHNPKSTVYPDYGGRGIYISAYWATYERFRAWAVTNDYREGLHLHRVDNDGPYSPANCRWVTPRENARTKRNVHLTSEDVAVIKRLILDGAPYSTIGEGFPKLTLGMYRSIKYNEKWQDVQPAEAA